MLDVRENDEIIRMVSAGFFLGLRVSQSINNLPPPDDTRYVALLETLTRLAAGEEMSLDGEAELKLQRPEIVELAEIQRDNSQLQQGIAQAVLRRLGVAGSK